MTSRDEPEQDAGAGAGESQADGKPAEGVDKPAPRAEDLHSQAEPGIAPSTDGLLPWTFWPALAIGLVLIGFGVHTAYRRASGLHNPHGLGRWVISGLVVHDGFWAPLAIAVGWVSARLLPAAVRAPVRVGLALSVMLVVVFAPVYRRYGAIADNPTVDPHNSGAGLLVLIALIWVGVALVCVRGIVRART